MWSQEGQLELSYKTAFTEKAIGLLLFLALN